MTGCRSRPWTRWTNGSASRRRAATSPSTSRRPPRPSSSSACGRRRKPEACTERCLAGFPANPGKGPFGPDWQRGQSWSAERHHRCYGHRAARREQGPASVGDSSSRGPRRSTEALHLAQHHRGRLDRQAGDDQGPQIQVAGRTLTSPLRHPFASGLHRSAMSATQVIGLVVLVLGVLALLGGGGYMLKAYNDQDENNDGFFTNPEEGDENKGQFYNGMYVAIGGVVFIVAGLVMMRMGASPR